MDKDKLEDSPSDEGLNFKTLLIWIGGAQSEESSQLKRQQERKLTRDGTD